MEVRRQITWFDHKPKWVGRGTNSWLCPPPTYPRIQHKLDAGMLRQHHPAGARVEGAVVGGAVGAVDEGDAVG